MNRARAIPFIAAIVLLVCACGDDSASPPGRDAGSDGAVDPLVAVPPERLSANAMESCPGLYASTAPAEGQNDGFEVDGQSRNFWLMLPDPSFQGPRPLFVAFNGTGGNGRDFAEYIRMSEWVSRGFIGLAPSSNDNGMIWPAWDALRRPDDQDRQNPDLDYFDRVVACVAAHHEVDRNRIYVGGHSAGGIETNYVLQRRSELLAGAIVASGVFSLTSPNGGAPLDPVLALVTWGGDGDHYTGSTSGVAVPLIDFVAEASLASRFYAARVGHVRCSMDVGHAWLVPLDSWMIDVLLAHPKGLSGHDAIVLPPMPDGVAATCDTEPFVHESTLQVDCPASTRAGCHELCQLAADCAVENTTVGPVLAPQLAMIGFGGVNNADCSGCVSTCESGATTPADAEVLSCLSSAQASAMCGPGVSGATPLIGAINSCCDARSDSPYCLEVCRAILTSDLAQTFLPTCVSLVPMGM